MTVAQLQTLCASWLDDPSFGYFTQAQLLVFLNNAQKEVQKQLIQAGENWYLKSAITAVVANQRDYILPSDFLSLNRLELIVSGDPCAATDSQTLNSITLNQQDLFPKTPTMPFSYYLKKNRLTLVPVPDTSYYLKLYYSYQIVDLVEQTDTPDIPDRYQEYIAVLATLDGFLKDGRDPSTMLMKKQFYLDLMKQDAEQRAVDSSRAVIISSVDDTDVWW